ncbi:probable G-protein coupled receptor 82 [Bufo bufo]|uniref:probable G-protein coupled receptor 82 n=1 Tax=Bufo bufo TaxID=8384 RepID=UPI001ABDE165|nr:probable G-protein coupled receptor 82 [Bufo bufo]
MSNKTDCLHFTAITSTGLPVVYALMFLPSLTGNIISLVIFKRLSRKTSTHIYLITLAASNIVLSAGQPFQVMYYSQAWSWPYDSALCSIVYEGVSILTHCSMCVSITIFCWIAVSRYATLTRHKERGQVKPETIYEKIIFGQILKAFRNPKFAFYLCAGVWFSFASVNMVCFLVNLERAPDKACFDKEAEIDEQLYKITSVVESACFFTFFLVVLLFYYFFIKHIQQLQVDSCIGEKHLVYRKVKHHLIIIVALLLLCFTPYHLSKFLLVGFDHSQGCQRLSALIEIKNCCLCLAEFRSCTDPIVYFCLDETFKKNFLLFWRKRSTERGQSGEANHQSTVQTPTSSGRII